MELTPLMEWTFVSEAPPTDEVKKILIDGEQVHAAYKTLRDMAVVTDKRIVIADKQGARRHQTICLLPHLPGLAAASFSQQNHTRALQQLAPSETVLGIVEWPEDLQL